MHEEMKKPKPRDSLLLPLMKKTFQDRRIFIQNDVSAVLDILEHYPVLGVCSVFMLLTVTVFFESHTTCLLYDFLLLIVRQMASCLAMCGVLLLHIQVHSKHYPWPRNKLTEYHLLGYAEWDK